MRFDDKLATVLAQPLDTASRRAAAWRQVVDVLAQQRSATGDALSYEAYDLVRHLRADVPLHIRAEAACAIAGRRLSPDLVALMAEEPPSVSGPLIGSVRLEPDEWLKLLPRLSPTARSLLRHRRDLGPAVMKGLASFGASDFVLASTPHPGVPEPRDVAQPDTEAALTAGESQIRDLLARIKAYRESARPPQPLPVAEEEAVPPAEDFRFETGPDGIILWVEGAPRGPLIGATIAIAAGRDAGVDGHAAGAYRRRAPFRDARLTVAAGGPVAGEWRISGVPFFDPRDGRFTGYRGTARRPRAGETAGPVAEVGLYGSGLAPDSLRQLVHELRTPLNAIVGFAEMIEHQILGPAASGYRSRAGDIIAQGRRLLAAVDDLDMAARIQSQRAARVETPVDTATLLKRLHADYEPVAAERGVRLDFRIATGLPPAGADPVAAERMFARLLAATIGLAEAGEAIAVTLDRVNGDGPLRLSVVRPRLLRNRDEDALLDPGYSPEGDWPDAPVLGLGFALRLVRNLASSAGGSLEIQPDAFVLRLPARSEAALTGNG